MSRDTYMNARGETVIPYHVFQALNPKTVCDELKVAEKRRKDAQK